MSVAIRGRWTLLKFLHSGGFGETFVVKDSLTEEILVAKLEHSSSMHPTLLFEFILYLRFKSCPCVPRIVGYCEDGEYRVLIMERLGSDLWHLVVGEKRKLTFSQIAYIGLQMLDCLEHIHKLGFVHRDVKPGNILLGRTEYANRVYLIDYGLAKKTVSHSRNEMVIQDGDVSSHCGTTSRYASTFALMNREQSYRDDVESLGYTLLELYNGKLPWNKYHSKTEICRMKCQLKKSNIQMKIPKMFLQWTSQCSSTPFSSLPDYVFFRTLLQVGVSEEKNIQSVEEIEVALNTAGSQLAALQIDMERKE